MTWHRISLNGCFQLKIHGNGVHVNGEIYERLIRERLQSETLQKQADMLMQDNAPCHRASRVPRVFDEKNFQVLDWLRNSPDINPIKNAKFILMRQVGQMLPKGEVHLGNFSLAWESIITPE